MNIGYFCRHILNHLRKERKRTNTLKLLKKKDVKIIAHRGLSGIEVENSIAAFVAAGNRSYFGIEADVHNTKDGKFIIIHDDDTSRVCTENYVVEQTDYNILRTLNLKSKYGSDLRSDLKLPSLEEYISVCINYNKVPVLELKNQMSKEHIYEICDMVEKKSLMKNIIFISFCFENLKVIRQKYPAVQLQFLTTEFSDELILKLKKYKIDLDFYFAGVDKKMVKRCHESGIKVNCWTVNRIGDAKRLISCGVDYITTNIIE